MSQLNLTCSSSPPWCRAGPSLITLGALLPHPPHPVTLKVLRSHPSALILPVCLLSSYAHHSLWMAVPARPPPSWFTSTLRLERPSQCPSLVMSCIPQPHKSFPGPHFCGGWQWKLPDVAHTGPCGTLTLGPPTGPAPWSHQTTSAFPNHQFHASYFALPPFFPHS